MFGPEPHINNELCPIIRRLMQRPKTTTKNAATAKKLRRLGDLDAHGKCLSRLATGDMCADPT